MATITTEAPAIGRRLRLFVYGTLQPQGGTAMGAWVAARTVRAQPASMSGRLHGIRDEGGWFPALVPGRGEVRGTVCDLRLGPGDLALLDRYEGPEYRRMTLPVRTAGGRRLRVQVYAWRGRPPAGAPRIGADFLAWLEAGRRGIYTSSRT